MNHRLKLIFIWTLLTALPAHMYASAELHINKRIRGTVVDADTNEPLPGAIVRIARSNDRSVTNRDGHFLFSTVPFEKGNLEITLMGYATEMVPYDVNEQQDLTIRLTATDISLNEVVVSGNRTETRRMEAPILVSVTDAKLFKATGSINLDQALKFNPGVRVEDNCQNCGFNQVRINGLDGPYTQVLINSRSIFGTVAAVYGLEMIPLEMIDRVEIVRGGGSALYGSNAIGGTVNIITKAPLSSATTASYSTEWYRDNLKHPAHNVSFFSSTVSKDFKSGISVFGRMQSRDAMDLVRPGSKLPADPAKGLPAGRDGYSELPEIRNVTLGASAYLHPLEHGKLSLDYIYTNEYRRGGDNLTRPEHEAHIAERLSHRIHSGVAKWDQYTQDGRGLWSSFVAGSNTYRSSYYGGGPVKPADFKDPDTMPSPEDLYKAFNAYGTTRDLTMQIGTQYNYNFDHFLFMPFQTLLGVEHTYNKLNDSSGIREAGIDQKIATTAGFLQGEWKNESLSLLLGVRYDHLGLSSDEQVQEKKLSKLNIFTPRAVLRYNPIKPLSLRLSYAEGFRAPAYFEEELHVAYANGEGRVHVLAEDLREERSRSVNGSIDYYIGDHHSDWMANLMLEGFYTKILHKFVTVEKGDIALVRNVDENGEHVNATVYGVNGEVRIGYRNLTSLQLGLTVQRSLYDTPQLLADDTEKQREFVRTPNVYGYFVWDFTPHRQWKLNLSGDYTGKMFVPHLATDAEGAYITNTSANLITRSTPFMVFNAQVSYTFNVMGSNKIDLIGGINNLFDSYQKDFDEGPNRDSGYVYGPKTPRMMYTTIRWTI